MKKALSLKVILILSIFALVISCLSGIVFADSNFEYDYLDVSAYVDSQIKSINISYYTEIDSNLLGRNVKNDDYGDYIEALSFEISPDEIEVEMRLYVNFCGVSLNYLNGEFDTYTVFPENGEDIHLLLSDYAIGLGYDENSFVLTSYSSKFKELLSLHLLSYIELFSENFLVSFDVVLGNSVIENQTVAYGDYATVPENPVAEGYTFNGWTPDITTTPITQNITFVAQWQRNSYTVTFDTDGGSTVESQDILHGNKAVLPANPTKEGYTFTGWTPDITTTPITQNITFVAQWQRNSYTVTFDTDGGSTVESQDILHGNKAVLPVNPTKEGYTFIGWTPDIQTTVITQNITFTAQWERNSYTVTFDTDGGSTVESQNILHGNKAVLPENPTKEGYTFTGWTPDITTTPITQNITFTAQWERNSYTVTFDLNGGERVGGGELVQTVVHGENPVFPEVEKFGYYSYSWTGGAYGGITSDRTLTAVWFEKYYTVEFKTTNGIWVSGQTSQQVQEGQAAQAPVLMRDGYILSWDKSFDFVTSDLVVNPVWTPIQIVVTFDLNGGERIGGGELEQVGIYNETDLYAPEVRRVGYTFKGWTPAKPAFFPLENTTYIAQWEINTYTVKFYDCNNNLIEEQTIEYGQSPEDFSVSVVIVGKIFSYWQLSDGNRIDEYNGYKSYVITEDVVFNMVCVDRLVTITFDLNGCVRIGGGELVQRVQYANEIVLPEISQEAFLNGLDYYKFSKWLGLPESDLDLLNKENITVVAGLTLVPSYVVIFDTDGGSLIENQIVLQGGKVVEPENPTKEGYTFNGWSPDINTPITEDITFTAQWKINTYMVIFDLNGGERVGDVDLIQNVVHGEYAVCPANPVRFGYTFIGWDFDVETTVITSGRVFQAQWQINTYVVTFNLNGGEYVGGGELVQNIEFGSYPVYPENPIWQGHIFKGWTPNLTVDGIVEDTQFVAIWETERYVVIFDDLNGNVNQQFVYYGDLAQLPENPIKDGFVFVRWTPDVSKPITQDTLFKPVWGVEITFVVVSSGLSEYWQVPELVETVVIELNTVLNYRSDFEIPNYHEFYCWCTYENLDIVFDDDIELGIYDNYFLKEFVITEPMTIYALYKQRTFTVTFNYNGGQFVGTTDRNSYIADGQIFTYPFEGFEDLRFIVFGKAGGGRTSGDLSFLASFYKEGYYVSGWTYDLAYKPYLEDIVLSPIWTEGYSITFDFGEYRLKDYSIISELPYDLFDGAIWNLPKGYVFERRTVERLLNAFEYDGGFYLGLNKPDGFYTDKKCEIGDLYDLTEPLNSSILLYIGSHTKIGLWDALKLFFTDFDTFKSEVSLFMRLLVYSVVIAAVLLIFYILLALLKTIFKSKRRK